MVMGLVVMGIIHLNAILLLEQVKGVVEMDKKGTVCIIFVHL